MKNVKKIILFIAFILGVTLLVVITANYTIALNAKNKTFSAVSKIPKNKVGLVLGTSKLLKNGNINLYFRFRINATVKLFKNNKIDFVLVSGDNGNHNYDEPTHFKNELIANGIPANKIFLDYAGFRTLDSVVRAKHIFGQLSITIISQKFHNERAIFLSEKHGIKAIGFNAKGVNTRYGFKTKIREYFARTKAYLDILFNTKPRFLGNSIEIRS